MSTFIYEQGPSMPYIIRSYPRTTISSGYYIIVA